MGEMAGKYNPLTKTFDASNGKIPSDVRKQANEICRKYCGWKKPNEIPKLYDDLEKIGITGIIINGYPRKSESGGKSWSVNFDYNGERCTNSKFVYQVYEGQNEKDEYNIYIS